MTQINKHYFETTEEAYSACQMIPCKRPDGQDFQVGDTIIIKRERVCGVAYTWPIAVTTKHGQLHTLATLGDCCGIVSDSDNDLTLEHFAAAEEAAAEERMWTDIMQIRKEYNEECAREEAEEIRSVTAKEMFAATTGKFKGYRYTAHTKDGTEIVVRKSATRLYENAFFFDSHVNYSVKDDSMAGRVTLGKKAPGYDGLIRTITIKLEA